DQHFNYTLVAADTIESAAGWLASIIHDNRDAGGVDATASGAVITLTYNGAPGSNGNRVGVYGTVYGAREEYWGPASSMFSGGVSPSRWRIDLDFGNLHDTAGQPVTTANVRRVRWTWAADLQPANYVRSEFRVLVENWQVTGTNLGYMMAGPGSRR